MDRIIRELNTHGTLEDGFRLLQEKREYVTYPEDSTFRIWYSDVPWRYENHYHTAVEVLWTLEGKVTYAVEGKSYDIRKDEVLIVPPGKEHALVMGEGSSRYLFLFEPDFILSMLDAKRLSSGLERVFHLKGDAEGRKEIIALLQEAVDIYHEGDLMWNTLCYSCIMRMYAILGQRYLAGMAVRRHPGAAGEDQEMIAGVLTYINNHYQEDVTLDQVASFAGFSRYYFSRSFRSKTGYSFKEYLCQKRIQVATDLLIHTRTPIQEIARESGFGSVATFNRLFRDYKKCTPTQYRAIYGTY